MILTDSLIDRLFVPALLLLAACFFASGWFLSSAYRDYKESIETKKIFDGLRFSGDLTHSEALGLAYEYDSNNPDWVCVNVNGMSYSRCMEVASHECGHEIFASLCEDNPEVCLKVEEEIKQ